MTESNSVLATFSNDLATAVEQAAASELHEGFGALDDDVLDTVVVDERLETTKAKEGIEHRVRQAGLVSRGHRRGAFVHPVDHGCVDELQDNGPSEFLLAGLVQAPAVSRNGLTELV